MDTTLQPNTKVKNKLSLAGILCIICGLAVCVFTLNNLLIYLSDWFSTICAYIESYYGRITIERIFDFIFNTSMLRSALFKSLIINVPTQLISLALNCLSALSFIVFGLLIIKEKRSKILLFFPAVQLGILLLQMLGIIFSVILYIFNLFTNLLNHSVPFSYIVSNYIPGIISGLVGLIPVFIIAVGFVLLAVIILAATGKKEQPTDGKKAKLLNILTPACIAGAPLINICGAVIGGLYSIFSVLFLNGGYGTATRLVYYAFRTLGISFPYAIIGILDALISSILSVAHHGIMAALLAVTFYLVAKWLTAPKATDTL